MKQPQEQTDMNVSSKGGKIIEENHCSASVRFHDCDQMSESRGDAFEDDLIHEYK